MQRYLCKSCNYTVEKRKNAKDESLKRRALELYLDGLGFIYTIRNWKLDLWYEKGL